MKSDILIAVTILLAFLIALAVSVNNIENLCEPKPKIELGPVQEKVIEKGVMI